MGIIGSQLNTELILHTASATVCYKCSMVESMHCSCFNSPSGRNVESSKPRLKGVLFYSPPYFVFWKVWRRCGHRLPCLCGWGHWRRSVTGLERQKQNASLQEHAMPKLKMTNLWLRGACRAHTSFLPCFYPFPLDTGYQHSSTAWTKPWRGPRSSLQTRISILGLHLVFLVTGSNFSIHVAYSLSCSKLSLSSSNLLSLSIAFRSVKFRVRNLKSSRDL